MPDYGQDFAGAIDIDPLLRMKSGAPLMADVCARRLFCRKGSLLSNPNDNTLDARDFLAQGVSKKEDLFKIQGRCQSALLGDPRVSTVSIVAEFTFSTGLLTLRIQGTGSEGPFALTLGITALTVRFLLDN